MGSYLHTFSRKQNAKRPLFSADPKLVVIIKEVLSFYCDFPNFYRFLFVVFIRITLVFDIFMERPTVAANFKL